MKEKSFFIKMLAASAILGILFVLLQPQFLNIVDFRLRNAFSGTTDGTIDKRILVVTIDDRSLESIGQWPWPRSKFAAIMRHLGQADAVGWDLFLNEPDRHSPKRLADALTKLGGKVSMSGIDKTMIDSDAAFADALLKNRGFLCSWFSSKKKDPFTPIRVDGNGKQRVPTFNGVKMPCQAYADVPTGLCGAMYGPDNVISSVEPLVRIQGEGFPLFPIRALMRAEQVNSVRLDEGRLQVGKYVLPIDAGGALHLVFPESLKEFHTMSLADIFTYPPEAFKNKIILIGATATGLNDLRPSVLSPATPGVFFHATVINMALKGLGSSSLRLFPGAVYIMSAALGAGAAALAFLSPPAAFLSVFSLIGAIVVLSALLMHNGVWFPPSYLIMAIIAGFSLAGSCLFIRHSLRCQRLKTFLNIRFPAGMKAPEPGLRFMEATVLVAGFRNFRVFVEKDGHEAAVDALNEFFTIASAIIRKNGGIVCNPMGGIFMAVWPQNGTGAVTAAIELYNSLPAFRTRMLDRHGVAITYCMGIHYGQALAGLSCRSGSWGYWAAGEAVEIAALVWRFCKKSDDGILCTESIAEQWNGRTEPAGEMHTEDGTITMRRVIC